MKKKLMSLVLAMAMILSALPAAAAAEPLSEYAGETVAVRVAHFHGDGEVTKETVEVNVPQRATKKDAQKLFNSAADSVAKVGGAAKSVESGEEGLGAYSPVPVTNTFTRPIDPITLNRSYNSLRFQFHTGVKSGDATTLILKLDSILMEGVTTSKVLSYELGADQTEKAQVTIIVVDGESYIGGEAFFQNGDTIEVNCKVNRGSVRFGGLVISGTY